MRVTRHIIFWVVIHILLTLFFGSRNNDFLQSFYFVSLLLPVIIGTNYIFNFLVDRYLLRKRFLRFSLYIFYTMIASMYLQMVVITVAFIVLANYQYAELHPAATNIIQLTITLYFIVLAISFARLVQNFLSEKSKREDLLNKEQNDYLQFISERKKTRIPLSEIVFLESLNDKVEIHTTKKSMMTKKLISQLEQELPSQFIRVHRSFIVNQLFVDSFNHELLFMQGREIPISRKYKKEALNFLQGSIPT